MERKNRLNNVESLLSNEDMETVTKMAEKYSMTVQELGKWLTRKESKVYRIQILLSTKECAYIERKRKKLNLTRSKYSTLCFEKMMKEELYKDIDLSQFCKRSSKAKDEGAKKERAVVSICDSNQYMRLKRFCEEYGVPVAGFLRYCALNINLTDWFWLRLNVMGRWKYELDAV